MHLSYTVKKKKEFSVRFTDISFNIKMENSVDLRFLLFQKNYSIGLSLVASKFQHNIHTFCMV